MDSSRTQRLGLALLVVGVLLLFVRLFSWDVGWLLWPLFILVPGVLSLLAAAFGGPSLASLFIPGSVVTTVGTILFLQNATDHFESWAYAWALLPAAVGVGLMLYGRRSGKLEVVARGRRLAGIFAAVFPVAAVFFEGFIFNDLTDTWFFRTGLPLLLIAAGVFLLLRRTDARSRVD